MISVNQYACIGCGICTSLCPKVFSMNAEGKAVVVSQDDTACARNAASSCPVSAISVE